MTDWNDHQWKANGQAKQVGGGRFTNDVGRYLHPRAEACTHRRLAKRATCPDCGQVRNVCLLELE
ncbi:MAG: hypothetical protein ACHQQR_00805 [Gemmatimonadales bacterium]